uniref:Uncharacterized protein n=1 Tax=Glossina palpalis gambiensis TaxID=67801 RepID=A0A1B0BXY1_9MUSC
MNNSNDANINSNKSPLYIVIRTLINNERLDKIYGFNVDVRGNWRYGNNKLKFNRDNTINMGNIKWAMTPDILINTTVYKRHYQPGTKAFKYQRKRLSNLIAPTDPKDAVIKAYLLRKMIHELYTTIKNNINNEAKKIEITLKDQLINANKSYMNKIEKRFDKIEEYIFKWIGVEQPQEKYDKELNSMRGDLTKLQTTLASNVEEYVTIIEQTVKAYLYDENKKFIHKPEERFQIIEDYLFKSMWW